MALSAPLVLDKFSMATFFRNEPEIKIQLKIVTGPW